MDPNDDTEADEVDLLVLLPSSIRTNSLTMLLSLVSVLWVAVEIGICYDVIKQYSTK